MTNCLDLPTLLASGLLLVQYMLVSFGISSSRLKLSLTGRFGPKSQAIAIRQVRDWMKQIPVGDSISLRCESCVPEKQYRIWKKWFLKNESPEWEINDKYKSFFFYRNE